MITCSHCGGEAANEGLVCERCFQIEGLVDEVIVLTARLNAAKRVIEIVRLNSASWYLNEALAAYDAALEAK